MGGRPVVHGTTHRLTQSDALFSGPLGHERESGSWMDGCGIRPASAKSVELLAER